MEKTRTGRIRTAGRILARRAGGILQPIRSHGLVSIGALSLFLTATTASALPATASQEDDPDGADDPGLTLFLETAGNQAAMSSYSFVVTEGGNVSGRLTFLSNEYPEYFGTQYNDLYSVTLATPQGVIDLASGNLNNSSWGPGSQGYNGTATTVEFSEDLSRFAGEALNLRVYVANVEDQLYDSAVSVSDLRIDDVPPCSDDDLHELHGLPASGRPRNLLDGWDRRFQGSRGARFMSLVEAAAAEAGINPGLLAVNALTENSSMSVWLSSGPVDTPESGVDDWDGLASRIESRVPGPPDISTAPTGEVFRNEQDRDIPILAFANGRDALRAMALTLRYAEVRMVEDGWQGFADLPANVRFSLQRYAFNRGIPGAIDLVEAAGANGGADLLIPTGEIGPSHPQRTATVRGAQAAHVANEIFGEGVTCR